MKKLTSKVLSVFFVCCLGGCVNYSQEIADSLASQCSSITTEESMVLQFGAPTSVQHIRDMTIYKYKWSAGVVHGDYSSHEVYKECEIIFKNGKMINFRTHAQT